MTAVGAPRYCAAAGTVSRQAGDETVVVDLDGERYFSLNRSGAVAWDQLVSGAALDDVVAAVVSAFDVDPASARADLDELVDQLVDAGLLGVTD